MHRATQLHFQRLPPEAQRAALWRLAWRRLTPEQIARRMGGTWEQVRRAMHDELAPALPHWAHRSAQVAVNA